MREKLQARTNRKHSIYNIGDILIALMLETIEYYLVIFEYKFHSI